jgi:hypothetical protein
VLSGHGVPAVPLVPVVGAGSPDKLVVMVGVVLGAVLVGAVVPVVVGVGVGVGVVRGVLPAALVGTAAELLPGVYPLGATIRVTVLPRLTSLFAGSVPATVPAPRVSPRARSSATVASRRVTTRPSRWSWFCTTSAFWPM